MLAHNNIQSQSMFCISQMMHKKIFQADDIQRTTLTHIISFQCIFPSIVEHFSKCIGNKTHGFCSPFSHHFIKLNVSFDSFETNLGHALSMRFILFLNIDFNFPRFYAHKWLIFNNKNILAQIPVTLLFYLNHIRWSRALTRQ